MGVQLPLVKLEDQDQKSPSYIPVQDSPRTPSTPDIRSDLSLRTPSTPDTKNDLTLSAAQSSLGLARVSEISTRTKKFLGNRNPLVFQPTSLDTAKNFLLGQKVVLPPRNPNRRFISFNTPLSSPTQPSAMICHGCHGRMGQGAHDGSAPGKNVCSLPHSSDCPGSVVEDDLWRSCPVGYHFGMGFERTLQQSDFMQQHSSTGIQGPGSLVPPQPHFVTPQTDRQDLGMPEQGFHLVDHQADQQFRQASVSGQQQIQPSFSTPHHNASAPQIPQSAGQGVAQGLGQSLHQGVGIVSQHLNSVSNSAPLDPSILGQQQVVTPQPSGDVHEPAQEGGQGAWGDRLRERQAGLNYNEETAIDLSTTISETENRDRAHVQVATLRANNQAANKAATSNDASSTFPYNIKDLRSNPADRLLVEERMQVIRTDAPSLSAAPSAPPHPDDVPGESSHPRGQATPYQFTSAQLFQPPQVRPRVQSSPYQFSQQQLLGVQTSGQQVPTNTGVGFSQHHQAGNQYQIPQHHSAQQYQLPQTHPAQQQRLSQMLLGQHQQQVPQPSIPQQQHLYRPMVPTSHHQHAQQGGQLPLHAFGTQTGQHQQQQQLQQLPGQQQWQHQPQATGGLLHMSQNASQSSSNVQSRYVTDGSGRRVTIGAPVLASAVPSHFRQQSPVLPTVSDHAVRPHTRYEYRYDQYTGVRYQVEVPATPTHCPPSNQPSTAPAHLSSQHQSNQRVPLHTYQQLPGSQQFAAPANLPWQSTHTEPVQAENNADQTMAQRIQESVKGIVNIVESGGTTKSLKLMDYAKRCPAKWSKNVKPDTMNLSLYGYAAVAEIEAGLSGRSGVHAEGELLARLRHVKNVFEVCCLNSSEKEFSAYGWTLARDYSQKVTNKVAQGETS